MLYRFASYVFDSSSSQLRHADRIITLTPLAVRLLSYLLRNAERTVSHDELVQSVWNGETVSGGALRQVVFELRRALGSDSELIHTTRGKGYRLAATFSVEEHNDAPHCGASALVGRSAELARIRDGWRQALAGHGRALVIMGPPGSGKTRLMRELTPQIKEAGAILLMGRAERGVGVPPLWMWTSALRPVLEQLGKRVRARLELVAPTVFSRLVGAHVEPEDARSRFALFDEYDRLLAALAAMAPLAILLDDLQWADDQSLALLGRVARNLSRTRILMVAATRRTFVLGSGLGRALTSLSHEPFNELLPLSTLRSADLADLIEQHTGAAQLRALAPHLHVVTSGNALMSTDLIRLLPQLPDGDLSQLLNPDNVEVRAILQRAVASLSDECAQLLMAASVLGEQVAVATLLAILGAHSRNVLQAVDEAIDAQLMVKAANGTCVRFSHPLLHMATLKSVPYHDRILWQARAKHVSSCRGERYAHQEAHWCPLCAPKTLAAQPEYPRRSI